MPPNSFTEWMIGRNVSRQKPRSPRPVLSFALETDDEAESDTLRVTYPRTGRSRRSTRSKKVHFRESAHGAEAKRAIAHLPSDSDTPASTDVETSPDESSTDEDLVMDCPCTNCITARRKVKKLERAKARRQKYLTDSSADEDEDNQAFVHARHKAKKAKEASSSKPKESSSRQKGKQNPSQQGKKSKAKPESETETTATDTETASETNAQTGADTGTSTEGETTDGFTTEAQTTEADTTGAETETESEKEAPKKIEKKAKTKPSKQDAAPVNKNEQGRGQKGKQGNTNQNQKGKQEKKSKQESQGEQSNTDTQKSDDDEKSKKKNLPRRKRSISKPRKSTPKGMARSQPISLPPHNPPLEARQVDLLMPPRPHVLQVEHTVEVQEDPRPNAFYDNSHGIMRVYHGPVYGNSQGMLYSSRIYGNQSLPMPVGTPHPTQNPWYNGFQYTVGPSGTAPTQPTPSQTPPPANSSSAPGKDQWYQGDGTVIVGQRTSESQSSRVAVGSNQKKQESTKRQTSPTSDTSNKIQEGGESNVLPSIEVTSPEKPKGSNGNRGGEAWGIQSAQGSPTRSKKSGKNSSKKNSPGHGKTLSDITRGIEELIAKDKAAAKARDDRNSQSDKSGSKESSPAADWQLNGNNNDSTAQDTNNISWGDAPADTTTSWGDTPAENTSWGDTPAEKTGADLSKANDGTQETTSQWGTGDNSGGAKTDAQDGSGGSVETIEKAGSDTPNNVLGGNDGSNGSVEEEKKDKSNAKPKKGKKSKAEDHHQYDNSTNSIPGGYPSSPPRSEQSYSERPPPTRSSPDNVGGGGGYGSPKEGSNKGSDSGKTTDNPNDWGDSGVSGSANGNGNGKSGASGDWQDNAVAQSSGDAFDDNDGWGDGVAANTNNNGASNDNIQW
ncbi:hypothetical protein GGR53DRAFT_3604 [Hypoxylon sp. FL1150]|nr:hypothetical protein GGR53DRAFT_3604 [Hypoxylon sp. FL1150]